MTRIDNARVIRAPRGNQLSAKSWLTEAPMRMLMNNLDPDVAEKPNELVVYGGIGRAARDWESFDRIVATLKRLEGDETLLVQSGKPVRVFRTHADAPRVLIANSNLVPHWANWEHFHLLERQGLMMVGQMTACGRTPSPTRRRRTIPPTAICRRAGPQANGSRGARPIQRA